MASNTLDDPASIPTPSNSESTLSDDNDAVNTSHAGVYFGPVLSPENRLALDSANRRHASLRRSSRLPTVPTQLTTHIANLSLDTVNNHSSGPDQPQEIPSAETFLEEPSSALATKIMQAWDNPSPPPSPTPPPHTSENLIERDLIPTTTTVDPPSSEANSSETDVAAVLDIRLDIAEEIPSDESSDTSPAQPDLITFDPPPFLHHTPRAVAAVLNGVVPFSADLSTTENHTSTVDQLLAISPQRQMIISSPSSVVEAPRTDVPPDPTLMRLDEQAPVSVHQNTAVNHSLSPPAPAILSEPLINLEQVAAVERPDSNVRRSTRQRRSVSPLVRPLVEQRSPSITGTSEPHDIQARAEELLLLSPRSGPARRRSLKGKERQSPLLPTGSMEAGDSPVIPALQNISITSSPVLHERPIREENVSRVRLRSLSPISTGVLEQLFPGQIGTMPNPQQNPFIPRPVFAASLAPSSPEASNTTQQTARTEPPHTPARRIPISQAVKEGSLPTQSALQFMSSGKPDLNVTNKETFGSPVFRRVALDDPSRTPAKRIPIPVADALSSASNPKSSLNAGLLRSKPIARSQSEEPRFPVALKKGRSASAEPASQSIVPSKNELVERTPSAVLGTPAKPSALLFPISRTPNRTTATIPELDESEADSNQLETPGTSSSPNRPFTVRPPPSRIESRIPRIGAKPYARATVKPPAVQAKSVEVHPAVALVPESLSETPAPLKPRAVRRATGKGTTPLVVNTAAGPGPKTYIHRARTLPAPSSTLKRKRDDEPRFSPPASQPIVIRKVTSSGNKSSVSSKLGISALDKSPEKARSPMPSTAASRATGLSQGKIKMRKVMTMKQSKTNLSPPPALPHTDIQTLPFSVSESRVELPALLIPALEESQERSVEATTVAESGNLMASDPGSVQDAGHTQQTEWPTETSAPTQELIVSPDSNVRRTRTRQSQIDVFGTVVPAKPSRRKTVSIPDFGAFAGMSALALKSLTASNTLRNQQQVVELQTELVRVDAKRPDSPTTKVRTILDRQKEERVLERQLRAERRAQRASGGEGDEDDIESSDVEGDDGLEHTVDDPSGVTTRHRRGPGEDEDYETPPKPDRSLKRGRFGDGDVYPLVDKRVKWNHGLSTTVYLDDSPPKPTRVRQELSKKGCLTPSAKTLRLDTMGNVLNATTPLANLVHENIIVKKFVYLDDPEPDPPPDFEIRSTRSKSKKTKS